MIEYLVIAIIAIICLPLIAHTIAVLKRGFD